MRKVILLVVVLVLIFVIVRMNKHHAGGAVAAGRGAVHTAAPEFSLQDLDGKPVDLAAYRGKVVLLDFWATWCVPCQSEIPHFVDFQNKYGAQGYQTVGISMDDDSKPVKAFAQQYKMNYPVAMGSSNLAESYGGILGLPVTFIIDREGKVAAKFVGATDIKNIQDKLEAVLQTK